MLNAKIEALRNEEAPSGLPVRGFEDLLVLSTAAFYDRDRERNFWRLDEYVFYRFERSYRRFMKALEEG